MRVCLDTKVLVQFTGEDEWCNRIQIALLDGHLEWAISTEILLEYEEVILRLSGASRWRQTAAFLGIIERMHGTIIKVNPTFRFRVIESDSDDNKFVDCAIAAQAQFIITEDRHFRVLSGTGYRSQRITPQEFVRLHL